VQIFQALAPGMWHPGSDSLAGPDSLLSFPIGINSYPAQALLSPGSEYGSILMRLQQFQAQGQEMPYPVSLPPYSPRAIIAGSLTVLIERVLTICLEKTIVEAIELPNKILAGCGTVLIGS